jgi:ubiquinone/menaquinone biosynthesis C-methylase UbiE
MNPKHLPLLRNPINHELLELQESAEGTTLVGKDSGTHFRVRDGIPVFIDTSRLTDANQRSRVYYNIMAPFYRLTQSFYYRLKGGEEQSRNEYLKHADIRATDRVLEVSIGNGINLKFLPERPEYFGIDVSWGQLKRCRNNAIAYGKEVALFQAEAEHLPFCGDAFDVVFNVGSINYIEDKKKAIDEMFRVAKPGARMMIADETEKAARAHNKFPIYRGFFNTSRAPAESTMDLLPRNATGVTFTEIRNGLYFCLQFRKAP